MLPSQWCRQIAFRILVRADQVKSYQESSQDFLRQIGKFRPRIGFDDFFEHPFLDLEHMPSEDALVKAVSLAEEAVRCDSVGELAEALAHYKAALEYFVPLLAQREPNATKREAMRKRTMDYMARAGDIKRLLLNPDQSSSPQSSSTFPPPSSKNTLTKRTSAETDHFLELKQLSHMNPKMSTGLEIAKAAEEYELEAQYVIALDKYQTALGMLIPLLQCEPRSSRRKTLLHAEVSKLMRRAECVKESLAIQEKVLADSCAMGEAVDGASKTCKIQ
jgi:hypothetical protein